MFRFENPSFLYLLLALVPLAVSAWGDLRWYRDQHRRLGDPALVQTMVENASSNRLRWRYGLTAWIVTMLTIALANPQWATERQRLTERSLDLFVALDISNSMYARDVVPSRMVQARHIALQMLDELKYERIGLILFAGNAYLQMPLTSDYSAARVFIQAANPALAGTQGTDIGSAIEKATMGFKTDESTHRVLIIVSDGEDHDPKAVEATRKANAEGLLVFTIGVGTPNGGLIPVGVRGGEDWKRDENGQPIRSQLNENLLREVAMAGGGRYYRYNQASTLYDDLRQTADRLEKQQYQERSFKAYESYYRPFALLALLGMLAGWLISSRLWPLVRKFVS